MLGNTNKLASPVNVLLGMMNARVSASSAMSPCISPSTSNHGAFVLSNSNVRRIFKALGRFDDPKFECDNKAALGLIPKRIISSAAKVVISASCSAVGS